MHSDKGKKLLILCVEDDDGQRKLRAEILEGEGYGVLSAGNTSDAVSLFRENPVCLVVADHMLQGTDGAALAAQLKDINPNIPLLMHSGSSPRSLRNIDAFIHKGEPVAAFLAMIRTLVNRYRS